MPTYDFLHDINECKHEWEEFLSITAPNPTHCPKCNAEGNVVKQISGGSGRGIVELYGQDLKDKVLSDAQQLKQDMHKKDSVYANLLGESKYESMQKQMDKQKRNR